MTTKYVEILPQTQFVASFQQGPRDALDAGGFVKGSIQCWCPNLTGADTVSVEVWESNTLDDSSFVLSLTTPVLLTAGIATAIEPLVLQTRYIRVNVVPTFAAGGTFANVRATVLLETQS